MGRRFRAALTVPVAVALLAGGTAALTTVRSPVVPAAPEPSPTHVAARPAVQEQRLAALRRSAGRLEREVAALRRRLQAARPHPAPAVPGEHQDRAHD